MAQKIMVDPTVLETTSKKMDEQASDYQQQYTKLFSEVDGMAAAWQGADNLAFVNQIKGFMDDFQKMSSLIKQYAQFLRDSATKYKNTQNDIITQAKGLTN